jgi:hypothetical protein
LQIEREEQKRQQQIEQARIDRLLDGAESLRQATNIRAYVAAVQAIDANETASISAEKMAGWSEWALAQANRIDPVRSARFIDTFDEKDDANLTWGKVWGVRDAIQISLYYQYITSIIGGRGVLSTPSIFCLRNPSCEVANDGSGHCGVG